MAKKRANGEGNIRKRKDGRWEGRYTAGYDPETGKRIIKNVLGKTQAEVKEKLAQAQQESTGLAVSRSEDYTVATWLRSWYELYAKPNVRPATADRYQLIIETYTIPRIGKIKLKKLTSRDLQKLYKDLMERGRIQKRSGKGNPGLSSTTVRSVHLTLHCAFERAVKERLMWQLNVSESHKHSRSAVIARTQRDDLCATVWPRWYPEGNKPQSIANAAVSKACARCAPSGEFSAAESGR